MMSAIVMRYQKNCPAGWGGTGRVLLQVFSVQRVSILGGIALVSLCILIFFVQQEYEKQ